MQTIQQQNTQAVLDYFQSVSQNQREEWALNHQKLYRMLFEQFPARPTAIVVLHLAVREGIAKDILDAGSNLSVMMTERLVLFLQNQTGITKDWARWVVEIWAEALGAEAQTKRRTVSFLAPKIEKRDKPMVRRSKSKPIELVGHRKALTDLCFSPDGRWIASSSLDRSIRIWDGLSGRMLTAFLGGHRDWIRCLKYQPSGAMLCSGGDDGSIRFWDMKRGKRLRKLSGHHGWVTSLQYSPDGSLVASGGMDGIVCVWQVETMELLGKYGPFSSRIASVVFDEKGEWLAVASENLVEVWSLRDKKRISKHPVKGSNICLLASPDGDLLIGSQDGMEKKNPVSGDRVLLFHDADFTSSIILDPVSPALITAGGRQLQIWDIRDARPLWRMNLKKTIRQIALSRQGRLAIALNASKGLLWEMERFDD